MQSTAQPTCFLIADISGYTAYLGGVELDHANDILSDLLGVIVGALRPGFQLSRIEGDAAFMFATVAEIDGSMLMDTIEACYFGFRRRRRDVRQATTCECKACVRIPDLDLKFVVHHGPAILQTIADRQELLGFDAIIVHRLTKNDVVERHDMSAYSLFSQKCIDVSDIEPAELGMQSHVEHYDDVGDVPAWAHDLERRWQEEQSRSRSSVSPDESILTVTATADVPRQVAWEFLTKPGQRMSWQPWVTEVTIEGAVGGRRGLGSANHCMHGEDAVVEEILDWRPFDYVTDRTILETPGGLVKVPHTIEFEARGDATTIEYRFGPPESEREIEAMKQIGPAYGEALRSALPDLIAQLEAAYAEIRADRGPEPEAGKAPGLPER